MTIVDDGHLPLHHTNSSGFCVLVVMAMVVVLVEHDRCISIK
jgi:hypothetical protein